MHPLRDKAAIVGVGWTDYMKWSGVSTLTTTLGGRLRTKVYVHYQLKQDLEHAWEDLQERDVYMDAGFLDDRLKEFIGKVVDNRHLVILHVIYKSQDDVDEALEKFEGLYDMIEKHDFRATRFD